jgi:hypothetical protein
MSNLPSSVWEKVRAGRANPAAYRNVWGPGVGRIDSPGRRRAQAIAQSRSRPIAKSRGRPYGSSNKNPRGDTSYRGHVQGLPYSASPDFSTYESPQHMTPRQSYLQVNRELSFGNQLRNTKVVTWLESLRKPSR